MIQRIQSVFLSLAVVLNLIAIFVPLWQYNAVDSVETLMGWDVVASTKGQNALSLPFAFDQKHIFQIAYLSLIVISSLFLLYIVFQFKDRQRQIKLSYIALILVLLEIVSMILFTQSGPYLITAANDNASVQFGFAFPILVLILTWFAIRRIRSDDELVKSVDRIR